MSGRRTIYEIDRRMARAAGAPRRASRVRRQVIARSFDLGEPIRLESSMPPPIDPTLSRAATPFSFARPFAIARSNVWNEALRHLPESPYPFSVADYETPASPAAERPESSMRPDDPDAAPTRAAPMSTESCNRVDDPDAPAPATPGQGTPQPKPSTAQSRRPSTRAAAAADWDLASDEAFEKTLQDAQRRAAASPPAGQQPAARPAAPAPQTLSAASGHDVFDRMASAMQHATAFDLGRHEIDDRFDAFENELRNPPRPAAQSAPKPDPAVEAALSLDDTDIVGQLAMMEADAPPCAAVPPAPVQSTPPAAPVTPPPSEAQP